MADLCPSLRRRVFFLRDIKPIAKRTKAHATKMPAITKHGRILCFDSMKIKKGQMYNASESHIRLSVTWPQCVQVLVGRTIGGVEGLFAPTALKLPSSCP